LEQLKIYQYFKYQEAFNPLITDEQQAKMRESKEKADSQVKTFGPPIRGRFRKIFPNG
jgi:hypothetical protein